jgi:hypothetical protein
MADFEVWTHVIGGTPASLIDYAHTDSEITSDALAKCLLIRYRMSFSSLLSTLRVPSDGDAIRFRLVQHGEAVHHWVMSREDGQWVLYHSQLGRFCATRRTLRPSDTESWVEALVDSVVSTSALWKLLRCDAWMIGGAIDYLELWTNQVAARSRSPIFALHGPTSFGGWISPLWVSNRFLAILVVICSSLFALFLGSQPGSFRTRLMIRFPIENVDCQIE